MLYMGAGPIFFSCPFILSSRARVCRPVESYLLGLPLLSVDRPKTSHLGGLPSCVTAQSSTLQLLRSKCNPTRRVEEKGDTESHSLCFFTRQDANRAQDDPVTEQSLTGGIRECVCWRKVAGIVSEIQGAPFIAPTLPPAAVEGQPERAAHSSIGNAVYCTNCGTSPPI